MKRFNPDKELKKIQHGKRNKIIFGVIALLLIISVGSTYALYQVRYSKRIIYSKVKPFNIRDVILSVKVEGENTSRNAFPSQNEGLIYNGIECDNQGITTATWDYGNWDLNLKSSGPNKCTVMFKKGTMPSLSSLCAGDMSLNECIAKHGLEVANIVEDYSTGHNLRYIGKNPNNYIWFNCDDYNNLTQSTAAQKCEKWRIIGLMSVIEGTSGKNLIVNNIKIIRANSVGKKQWHSSDANDWSSASLNTEYLNSTNYYLKNGYIDPDSGAKGITSASQAMIQKVIWNLGGPYNASTTAFQYYEAERSTRVYRSNPVIYNDLIGLMYPSDYGYATSGGNTYSRQQCIDTMLYTWSVAGYKEDCAENDWLFDSSYTQWTLSPSSYYSGQSFTITDSGMVYDFKTSNMYEVRPSLFLISSVKILDGDGSSGTPYILST